MKKRIVAILLAVMMLLAFAGCAGQNATETSPEATAEPTAAPEAESAAPESTTEPETDQVADGVYEGQSGGFGGLIKTAVTIEGGKLSNVEVIEHTESAGVSDTSINDLPARMVELQSYNLDAVSGATYSSNGVINAVKNALETAGIAEAFSQAPAANPQDVTLEADVVIVGGGIAGLTSAISAHEEGAKVILLEKQGRFGGSAVTSGGIVFATGSPLNKELDNDPAGMAAYWQSRANGVADDALLAFGAESSGESIQWLMDHGLEFQPETRPTGTYDKPLGHYTTTGGAGIIQPLVAKAQELGIEMYLDTPATKILTDGEKNVTGVEAEKKDGSKYTVNAKAVIMCTGGFDADAEMIATYSPDGNGSICHSNIGNTGDGLRMGMEVGADTVFHGGLIGFRIINPVLAYTNPLNSPMWIPTLAVTDEGNRFGDESVDYPIYFTNMVKSGRDDFYLIFDNTMAEAVTPVIAQGFGYEADSIEALAEAAGIDAAALTATFARYQELGEKGVDEDFGKASIAPLAQEGPYYAVKMQKATIGTMGGLKVDVNTQVLDADGAAIPGFYAVGEVANGGFFDKEYPASGTMLSMSTTYGRTAGKNATAFAKE